MALLKISARDWILWWNNGTTEAPDWFPVACLTSNKLASALDAIDATSKCGDDIQPGDSFSQTIDVDGFTVTESGEQTSVSEGQLYDLHVAKTIAEWKIGKLDPTVDLDYKYTGSGWVSKLDEDSTDKDKVKFSGTITISSPPMTREIETA